MSETTAATEPMTLQQVFDNAWRAYIIRKEGPGYGRRRLPLFPNYMACRYYDPETGNRCIIGHSVADLYDPWWDDPDNHQNDVRCLISNVPSVSERFSDINPSALDRLQSIHDGCAPDTSFHHFIEIKLRQFAQDWELTIPEE